MCPVRFLRGNAFFKGEIKQTGAGKIKANKDQSTKSKTKNAKFPPGFVVANMWLIEENVDNTNA